MYVYKDDGSLFEACPAASLPSTTPSLPTTHQTSHLFTYLPTHPLTNQLTMLTQVLTTLLLPTLLLAAPTSLLSPRQSACTPTSYTITSFTSTPQAVHFAFQSTFNSLSAVSDPATQGTTCDASAANGVFPSEFACATGRSNLIIGLRSDTPGNKYQVSHFWKCDG